MKIKRILRFLFAATATIVLAFSAAAESAEQTVTIPVTLTVVHTARSIDVTLPAALPVSVVNGRVLTADNLELRNHSDTVSVCVAGIRVVDGSFSVAPFAAFPAGERNRIALRINGCETAGAGALPLTEEAFPAIPAGSSLPVRYEAKVSASEDVSGTSAASIVFTLRVADRA